MYITIYIISRQNNLSLVCLYLSLYISSVAEKKNIKNKCPNNKNEIYNDKYKHTRDRLFDLHYKTMNTMIISYILKFLFNKNVDIKFSAQDAFLE